LSLVPLVLLIIIANRRISLGQDYYGAIGDARDKALAALLDEAFAAGAGIFLGTCILSGFFMENTELHTEIQDHGISIDGRKVCFFIIFMQNGFHLFYYCQHERRTRRCSQARTRMKLVFDIIDMIVKCIIGEKDIIDFGSGVIGFES